MLADALGFEHVQIVEHHFTPYGGYSPDPVTFLAAVAARTREIRVVTGAVVPAFVHPLKLAGKLAMLDNLSHGRLDAGFGRAFLPDEFAAFQVPLSESRRRFAEGVEICRKLWSETEVSWHGDWVSFGPVTLLPRTVQRPHPPIFVAATTSPESCAAAGRAGHHLQVVPTVTSREGLQEMLAAYREARRAAGHPGEGRIQLKYTCYLDEDRSRALERARRFEHNYIAKMTGAVAAWGGVRSDDYPGYEQLVEKVRRYDFEASLAGNKVLAGTPAEVTEQIATVREWFGAGLSVCLQFNPGCMPYEDAERAVRLFAAEVAPAFPATEIAAEATPETNAETAAGTGAQQAVAR
ncbi:alkanesulfonate monooxygenase SsuD/methylene tetrahydromethanopterin reductase-like flavin-dependent oxidoreductase (luciferase family) [Thermocatellispora tengchongensis]|uniref:Alkanesulfonate monooxygenase SsuD/methylene tetrahydromethanopterin reductase-like flavin-dependent oxidoreductase (Luciferase family) n=1 Tax=Thermocatellispora tengchongensis TaxID=1073253 RepID=A0A840P832_9ACTN|nr:alkanesulfonate monooxygenase SsuD/methylene tetrahydromethanopterin reductase-like flavin-dependent oxidoreductase (luciferase family) [Thermocatellispora tengchongensis]